jgi:hypothetical protein
MNFLSHKGWWKEPIGVAPQWLNRPKRTCHTIWCEVLITCVGMIIKSEIRDQHPEGRPPGLQVWDGEPDSLIDNGLKGNPTREQGGDCGKEIHSGHKDSTNYADQLDPVPSTGLLQQSKARRPYQYLLALRDLNTPPQQEVLNEILSSLFQIHIYYQKAGMLGWTQDSHVRTTPPRPHRWLTTNSSARKNDCLLAIISGGSEGLLRICLPRTFLGLPHQLLKLSPVCKGLWAPAIAAFLLETPSAQ